MVLQVGIVLAAAFENLFDTLRGLLGGVAVFKMFVRIVLIERAGGPGIKRGEMPSSVTRYRRYGRDSGAEISAPVSGLYSFMNFSTKGTGRLR
jgi:hypothetical protein